MATAAVIAALLLRAVVVSAGSVRTLDDLVDHFAQKQSPPARQRSADGQAPAREAQSVWVDPTGAVQGERPEDLEWGIQLACTKHHVSASAHHWRLDEEPFKHRLEVLRTVSLDPEFEKHHFAASQCVDTNYARRALTRGPAQLPLPCCRTPRCVLWSGPTSQARRVGGCGGVGKGGLHDGARRHS